MRVELMCQEHMVNNNVFELELLAVAVVESIVVDACALVGAIVGGLGPGMGPDGSRDLQI